ncbi:AraC family transcriptional regulator [Chitinophaga qingshengii]|uniref:AraC family transcriptional regulator n=1 Tax=Chitinophaga qingshengii TaxID=1569794 RepID=A0ABR7TQY2_9BACT|nr:AraC family transcriptional regulator [Chitinophaga qingshengii]MBC9931977.1 AraC family transcriptional regulator [Chitinophaga qingshengii]
MKIIVEKLPLSDNTSFVARTYSTPNFEVPWHRHIELELILIKEGAGISFIGNHVGRFETGDVFFIGSNVPHTFQRDADLATSAMVVQFKEDFWGDAFLKLPENKDLLKLFEIALHGLAIEGKSKQTLTSLILSLENQTGLKRIILLCECLDIIARGNDYTLLSTQIDTGLNAVKQERIDQIFQFTLENFKRPILISEVAKMVGLSVPTFCSYFKKCTKKKYIDFLNEIRIGYACKLLVDTQESITNICYESGFNTLAHFNNQFRKYHNITPSAYRKAFLSAERLEEISLIDREVQDA